MKIVELFCGTKSFSKVAEELGHETFTVDNNPIFNPDRCIDINLFFNHIDDEDFYKHLCDCDIVWASPPCQCFSVATIGKNWNKDYTPKNDKAANSQMLVIKTIEIISFLRPTYWFIENPRGMLRKMHFMQGFHRKTVTYCQYGDRRMKPTDIWTNLLSWYPKPMCKNGDKCHDSAPRGSKSGTQGLKNSIERAKVPHALCKEIFNAIEAVDVL